MRENLRLGLVASPEKRREAELIEGIARIFPRLAERLDQEAVTMSGGEQQMLAIARAMIAKPDLIMLDEPSEGIMPVLVDEMFELFRSMKAQGTTILLVEQNVELALGLADRAYVLDQGAVVHHAAARDLAGRRRDQGALLLGVSGGATEAVMRKVWSRRRGCSRICSAPRCGQ